MTSEVEEKKVGSATEMNTATHQYKDMTQSAIQTLYDISKSEVMTPSVGDAYSVPRDPHLRLRRTLTPSLNVGIPKYAEAQFMLSKGETSGKRISLEFSVHFDNETNKKYFTMDGYAFGASESEADVRIVTLHGISCGVSRTRWHKLGEKYNQILAEASSSKKKKVRFIALDWHSIDRSVDDDTNTEFLSCLPKHIIEVSPCDVEEIAMLHDTPDRQEWHRNFAKAAKVCPRTFTDGSKLLRGVIEEGLGWGTSNDTKFILGVKSWSGGLGMRLLSQLSRSKSETDRKFAKNIQGAIIMHPFFFDKSDIQEAMSSGVVKTALMCWALDDPLTPYKVSQMYLDAAGSNGNDDKIKLCTYECGGHHNFDGTEGLPNFDHTVIEWIDDLP
jgi:hypothetical protein